MRFDDSLDTVLAGEMAGPAGVQSAWRQLVDLIGRRRGGAPADAIQRLRAIRGDVPAGVRAASARGLERADPPAELVALFADDTHEVAAPVVRTARLSAAEWIALLPRMQPATRGVLRHRRDLDPAVARALESFGPSDFGLPAADLTEALIEAPVAEVAPVETVAEPVAPWGPAVWPEDEVETPAPEPEPEPIIAPAPVATVEAAPPPTFVAPEPSPLVPWAQVAQNLPIVAAAIEQARVDEPAPAPTVVAVAEPLVEAVAVPEPVRPIAEVPPVAPVADPVPPARGDDFAIAELVARIEAHRRDERPLPVAIPVAAAPVTRFRFETDAAGLIRWCDHTMRGALIGRDLAGPDNDGAVRGAFARRTTIRDARLDVPGEGDAAGAWRISATAAFDRASGRFTGYRGTARRPRRDEAPELVTAAPTATDDAQGDSLRQLVHELRTPTNAISGFAEMIEHELFGPVPPAYREQAATIRRQTAGLLDVIEDLDTAARIETRRLELRPTAVPLVPLLSGVMAELQTLADLRGTYITLDLADGIAVQGDARALERLFSRYLTALISTAARGEVLAGSIVREGAMVRFDLARPRAFVASDGGLLGGDAEVEQAAEGGPLLGAGFAFRLARGLASELGGSVVIETERLTLRLPAGEQAGMEQATV